MRYVFFVLACVLALPPVRAEIEIKFSQGYDRFEDLSDLTLDMPYVINENGHHVDVTFIQSFRGKSRREKAGSLYVSFFSSSERWSYIDDQRLVFLIDGDRVPVEVEWDGEVKDGYVIEFMRPKLTEFRRERLLEAKVIEGRIGFDEFKFGPRRMAAIAEFVKLCEEPDRPVPTGNWFPPEPPPKPKTPEELAAEQAEAGRMLAEKKESIEQEKAAKLQATLDRKLKLGKALEAANPKAALGYYQDVIELAPDSPQAKTARERIEAMRK